MRPSLKAVLLAVPLALPTGVSAWWGPPPGFPTPGYGPMPGTTEPVAPSPRLTLEPGVVEGGYRVVVHVAGAEPKDVVVEVVQGRLVVSTGGGEAIDAQRPGSYGYYHTRSRKQRILSLPFDADTQSMTRTDGEGQLELFIPRRP